MAATLHYNGAIVTHPDNSDSYTRRIVVNLQKGQCVYKKSCLHCPIFVENEKRLQAQFGKVKKIVARDCPLKNDASCPHVAEAKAYGLKEKSFSITNKVRNQISDRGAWLYHNSENKLIFVTLTLPPFKKSIKNEQLEIKLNEAFSRFIENCKSTYELRRYIAVREGDGINKRYHFHVIMDIPFVSFIRLNRAWLHTIKDVCQFSRNALTTDKKARTIKSIASATRYIAKYISKAGKEAHKTRVFFCDRETAQAVVKTRFDNDIIDLRAAGYPFEGWKYNDFCIRYTIRDRILSNKFFYEAVQFLFKPPPGNVKKSGGMVIFSEIEA